MKSSRKNGQFREQFLGALRYLNDSRRYILAVALIFFAGILLGAAFSANLGFLDEILKGIVNTIRDMNSSETILFILQNNIKSALYGMLFGVFLGIFPVVNALSNGLILGYVLKGVWAESGIHELWRILPHGVFELPAIFISLALGLKLGMFIFSKEKGKEFFTRARYSIIIFVFIVLPLLVVAAVIEGLLIAAYK